MSTKVKEKRPPKTIKEKKFVKAYLQTGNATEAAMQVYDARDRLSAGSIGQEILTKLDIKGLMEKRERLRDDMLLQDLESGLDANKVISAKILTDATGQTDDFIDVPDWQARHKYLETALKLKGHTGDKEQGNQYNQFNVWLEQKQDYGIS